MTTQPCSMSSSLEGPAGTTLGGRFFNENHHSGEGLSTGPRAWRQRHDGVSLRLRRSIRCQVRPDALQCSYDFKRASKDIVRRDTKSRMRRRSEAVRRFRAFAEKKSLKRN